MILSKPSSPGQATLVIGIKNIYADIANAGLKSSPQDQPT